MIELKIAQRLPVSRTSPRFPAPEGQNQLLSSRFLSQEERAALKAAALPLRRAGPGAHLAREGDQSDCLLIMTQGWACRYTITRAGARQLPAVIVPGDVGNLDALLFDRLDYGVRLLTEATIMPLPRDRVTALAANHPGIARTFTWLAMIENAILGKWTLSLGRRTSKERLAHLLCELSVRLGIEEQAESTFVFPMTQELIADALGLTSVHVNRVMQELRAEGLIVSANRTMTIPDVARLRRIAGFDPRYLHRDPPLDARLA